MSKIRLIPYSETPQVTALEYDEMRDLREHPDYEVTGGYPKVTDKRSCATDWWNGLPKDDKDEIKSLPNFDFSIFCECVGIER